MSMGSLFAVVILALLQPSPDRAFSQVNKRADVGTRLAVTAAGTWKTVQKGLEFRRMTMERLEPGYAIEFMLLRIDTRVIVPRVLTAETFHLKSADAKTFAEKAGAIAAINANYFDEKGRPLAYLKTPEREVNRSISKHRLYTGIFALGEAGPFVTHRDEFQPVQASAAVQSGPLLLHHSERLEVTTGSGRLARRTVIGTDKNGHLLVGVTEGVAGGLSFGELQELFSEPRWRLDALELLNLDGGGSSQLYVKSGKFEAWLPGTTEVPVAIGFFIKR